MKTKSKNNAIVTVSLPETQNACGENVRLPVSPSGMTKKQTSEKQEPNISQWLWSQGLSKFRGTVFAGDYISEEKRKGKEGVLNEISVMIHLWNLKELNDKNHDL